MYEEVPCEMYKVYEVKDDWKIMWNHDRKEGEDNHNNLDNLLIKWATTKGNYSKFCTGKTGTGGSRKKDACNQIADMINSASMRKICMGKQVHSRTKHLEKSFEKAYEFSFTETGQGPMEQSEGTFCEAILKMCPHYFDLFDVMKDHSSSMPQINSEDLDENIVEPLHSSDDNDESLIGNENAIQTNNQNDDNTATQDNSHCNRQASNNTTVEVVSTTTTTNIVPITTPLVMKWKKENGQRYTNSKNHCKSRDDSDLETFLAYQKEVPSLKNASIKESKGHNKEIKKLNK